MKYLNVLSLSLFILIFAKGVVLSENDKLTAANERLDAAQVTLISSQKEYTFASIDKQIQKIKDRIRKAELEIYNLECNGSSDYSYSYDSKNENENKNEKILDKRINKISKKIQRYEDRIEALKCLRTSLEFVN
jgi:predicted RNase H-like nuclease (RuvC/YqgF family)